MSTRAYSLAAIRSSGADKTQHARIQEALYVCGPLIKDDLAILLDMRHSSVTARLNEMVNMGVVKVASLVHNPATNRNVSLYALA
ncbi:hypothetical protein [Bordetella bronchiseptica]|uniref:hypothetical protein n=1 Tax=Bordetella bronchiseptica TaxID=518 RepID=UPI000460D0DB|nr:hypothetical protein [Bordetella bronchiseptica]KDD18742.1 hypothetical protein L522_4182 [Bordetella bronchiseptica MBORD707]